MVNLETVTELLGNAQQEATTFLRKDRNLPSADPEPLGHEILTHFDKRWKDTLLDFVREEFSNPRINPDFDELSTAFKGFLLEKIADLVFLPITYGASYSAASDEFTYKIYHNLFPANKVMVNRFNRKGIEGISVPDNLLLPRIELPTPSLGRGRTKFEPSASEEPKILHTIEVTANMNNDGVNVDYDPERKIYGLEKDRMMFPDIFDDTGVIFVVPLGTEVPDWVLYRPEDGKPAVRVRSFPFTATELRKFRNYLIYEAKDGDGETLSNIYRNSERRQSRRNYNDINRERA